MTPQLAVIRGLAKINYQLFEKISPEATRVENYQEDRFNVTVYSRKENLLGVVVLDGVVAKCYTHKDYKQVLVNERQEVKKSNRRKKKHHGDHSAI